MVEISRRRLLANAGILSAGAMLPTIGFAHNGGAHLPPGVQLWTVKAEMEKDFEGTLQALGKMGFKRVETAGWHGRTAAQFKAAADAAGLEIYSTHAGLKDLIDDLDGRLAFAKDVGAHYVVASSPAPRKALDPNKPWPIAVKEAMTLTDWQSNAQEMERIGARARAMGLQFAYHNHPGEFVKNEGRVPMDEIVRLTTRANVALELDLGWAAGAGYDPAAMIKKYQPRVHLLHVKDIGTKERVPGKIVDNWDSTVVGEGSIDWKKTFKAADKAPLRAWFIEQEEPFSEPPLQALAKSIAYIRSLKA